MEVFHYHLVTGRYKDVEARYVGKLGFRLVARHGRVGEEHVSVAAGMGWGDLERRGFRLRLSEIERGGVNVVVQPGQWELPRVDHLGIALDDDDLEGLLEEAARRGLTVQERDGRRTFVSTGAGYRLELHPKRRVERLLAERPAFRLAELRLRAADPERKAQALADLVGAERRGAAVELGDTVVAFVDGGPPGRPELQGELFV